MKESHRAAEEQRAMERIVAAASEVASEEKVEELRAVRRVRNPAPVIHMQELRIIADILEQAGNSESSKSKSKGKKKSDSSSDDEKSEGGS